MTTPLVNGELTISDNIQDVAEKLLERHPKIIGIGVCIWNAAESTKLVPTKFGTLITGYGPAKRPGRRISFF